MPVGPKQDTGNDIQDFTLTERDLLVLPTTSVTRVAGRVSQIVRSGAGDDGLTITVTVDYTRDGAGRVTSFVRTFAGGGRQRTETWTINRDGSNRVTTTPVVRT